MGLSTYFARIVHERMQLSTGYPPPRRPAAGGSAGAPPGERIDRPHLAVEAREHEPTAHELGLRDHVGVGDAPGDLAVPLEREGLDLGLGEDVRQPR